MKLINLLRALFVLSSTILISGCPTGPSGSLQVTILPVEAVSAGAQWSVDGGKWLNSGQVEAGLSVGDHLVTFKDALDWVEPAQATIQVIEKQTTQYYGLYTMTIRSALVHFTDSTTSPDESADDFFAAVGSEVATEGADAAEQAVDDAIIEFISNGGDYNDLNTRSAAISGGIFGGDDVAKRRLTRAKGKADGRSAIEIDALLKDSGQLICSDPTIHRNKVIFINGVLTDLPRFTLDYYTLKSALDGKINNGYDIWLQGFWNPSGVIQTAKCTVQKIDDFLSTFINLPVHDEITDCLDFMMAADVQANQNVVLVAHSQGNFYARQAINNLSLSERASINLLDLASPVTNTPQGLRNQSRIDIQGDPIPLISGLALQTFPYEGVKSYGDELQAQLHNNPHLDGDTVYLFEHHDFIESYMKGQAGAAIVQTIQNYCIPEPSEGEGEGESEGQNIQSCDLPGQVPTVISDLTVGIDGFPSAPYVVVTGTFLLQPDGFGSVRSGHSFTANGQASIDYGDLFLYKNAKVCLPTVTSYKGREYQGYTFDLSEGALLMMPNLQTMYSPITIRAGSNAQIDLSGLQTIVARDNSGVALVMQSGSYIDASSLNSMSNTSINITGSDTTLLLDSLKTATGEYYITIQQAGKLRASNLTSLAGYLYVSITGGSSFTGAATSYSFNDPSYLGSNESEIYVSDAGSILSLPQLRNLDFQTTFAGRFMTITVHDHAKLDLSALKTITMSDAAGGITFYADGGATINLSSLSEFDATRVFFTGNITRGKN